QSIQTVAEQAVAADIYYDGKDWKITDPGEVQKLAGLVEKSKYWVNTDFTSITLDYPDGTGYNIDCIVKDHAAFEKLLEGKEVQYG
ncbi:MAG: hypothetical protein IJ860_09165, partial [Eubacterium sp.]|nr:hypothetical protein [Eubacterium sp.]